MIISDAVQLALIASVAPTIAAIATFAHGKALKQMKLFKGLTKDQIRSRLRSLYYGWIRKFGL